MTRAEIRTELNNRGFEFDPEDLNRYINWGYFDFARRLRVREVESSQPFTVAAGQHLVTMSTLSEPIKSVSRLVITTSGYQHKLEPVDERTFWTEWAINGFADDLPLPSDQLGEPQFYYVLFENVLVIMPGCESTRTFQALSWQKVEPLETDSAESILPEAYEEGLLTAIVKQCHLRSNELERAERAEGRLRLILEEIINENAFAQTETQEQTETVAYA